jgi:hypothetical protein
MWGFGRGSTIFQSHSLYYLIQSYPILPFVYTYVWLSILYFVLHFIVPQLPISCNLLAQRPTINMMPISYLKSRPHNRMERYD